MKRWIESEDRRSASPMPVNTADEELLTKLIAMEISIAMGFAPGGILAGRSLQTPLTVLGNSQHKKQKIAEYIQVMKQMVFPKSVAVAPRVIYQELSIINYTRIAAADISSFIIQQTARLMEETFYFNGSHSIP